MVKVAAIMDQLKVGKLFVVCMLVIYIYSAIFSNLSTLSFSEQCLEHPKLAENIQPIFVTVDPARDSIEALQDYAKDFHPDYIFLTGTPEQVQKMAKKYRVYVSKADETDDGDYLVDHSIVLYFHDGEGEMVDFFTQSMKPSDITQKIHKAMTFVPSF